ncbi:AMP-binding protein [Polymorphospora rubra]|uniref:AMP-binding protein n=1 Tax=Polymorphospora rubra TaxID=338584 RepID=UPI0033E5C090
MTATPDRLTDHVHDLLARYGDPGASVAALLCDDHPADAVAYTVVEPDLSHTVLTYGELRDRSQRCAAALAGLGVEPGDRVATLLGKSVEYLVTLIGIWRLGAVHVPLFTAFAAPAILDRLADSRAKVLVCDADQRSKLATGDGVPADPPWRTVVVGGAAAPDLDFADLLAAQRPGWPAAVLGGAAPIIHIYTSGTTGRPKSVVVPTVALAGFRAYAEFGLDVRPDDVYWCAADPGWAYGLYFGILGSFTLGVPSVLLRGGFSPASTWQVLARFGVTNLTAAPTVYRALRAADLPVPAGLRLRCASSAGEPLTPDVNAWARDALGLLVYDHYGQTEAGMLINNHHHPLLRRPPRPGSMGQPMPGWSAAVLWPDRDDVAPPGVLGRIAIDRAASPLAWFTGYGVPADGAGGTAGTDPRFAAATGEKFTADGRWYLTGDTGTVDDDGYFHFSARDDDVIIMAGYRIGPFDVESVLCTHPAVVECAVVAVPDQVRGEVLESYVVLRDPARASADLAGELQRWVKTRFAAHAYPRTVHFVDALPKTPSGKIQRFVLRARRRAELDAAGPGPAGAGAVPRPAVPAVPTPAPAGGGA